MELTVSHTQSEILELVNNERIVSPNALPHWNESTGLWTVNVRNNMASSLFTTYWVYKINTKATPFSLSSLPEDAECPILLNPFVAVTFFVTGGPHIRFRIRNCTDKRQPDIFADLPLLPVERADTAFVESWKKSRVFYRISARNRYDARPLLYKQ